MSNSDLLADKIVALLRRHVQRGGGVDGQQLLTAVRQRLGAAPESASLIARFENAPEAAAPLLRLDLAQALAADAAWAEELARQADAIQAAAQDKGHWLHVESGSAVVGDNNTVLGEGSVYVGGNVSGTILTSSTKPEPAAGSGGQTSGFVRAPRQLLHHMDLYLGEGDLRTLCFDLHLDYENLSGNNKRERLISLIEAAEREQRLPALLQACAELRPNVPWSSL